MAYEQTVWPLSYIVESRSQWANSESLWARQAMSFVVSSAVMRKSCLRCIAGVGASGLPEELARRFASYKNVIVS